MKIYILIMTTVFLFTAACVSEKIPPLPENRPSYLSPEVSGAFIRADDLSNLRSRENIKAYSLGRRIDGSDDSLMYEGGVVYRVENESSWNLQPSLAVKLPFSGSSASAVKDNENALRAEIEVKANEQRRLYDYLKNVSKDASGQMKALESSAKIGRQLLDQNKALKERLLSSEQQKQALNSDLVKLKTQLGSLLKFYQKKEEEKIKSKFRRQ